MTDRGRNSHDQTGAPLPRVDLRSLHDATDAEQVDRVVGAAMARIGRSPRRVAPPTVWDDVALWLRPGLAAAGLVAAAALGTLATRPASSGTPVDVEQPASVEERVVEWVQSGRAPSTDELLVTFQGYGR